jgi:hypothetical protein
MPQRWTTFFAAAVLVAATAGVGAAQQESIDELRARAEQGDADAQFYLGVMYTNGRGVPQDDVQAYMWFNLSAALGQGEDAVKARDRVASRLTPDQRAEAQRLAREWDEAHPRD